MVLRCLQEIGMLRRFVERSSERVTLLAAFAIVAHSPLSSQAAMPTLYDAYLPLVQSLNDYGGNFTSIYVRRPVLDAIDAGSVSDPSLASTRDKLRKKMQQWSGLQDYETFSEFFEAYYEGVFYLVARLRALPLRSIPAGGKMGNTPDFAAANPPLVNFEVKTIDVADPDQTYEKTMEEGLDAKVEVVDRAARSGLGIAARTISPHGTARTRRDAVAQVMKKIDSNVKAGQYKAAPTFLVVSMARTAIHDRAENLRQWLPWPGQDRDASGQLFTVAAHQVDEPFFFFPEWGQRIENLGPLARAGILRDHEFIAGMIFLATNWSASNSPEPVAGVYSLNGIWNSAWERINGFGPQATAAAKTIFQDLCHAWNDTEDSRGRCLQTE
jgi:hypothetical protein